MSFVEKNFEYVTMPFGDFLHRVDRQERLYMRSVSSLPTSKSTSLATDFSSIADDYKFPPSLSYVRSHMHSSPLRISGPVRMWLHYDVMANVLCQIRGSKRLVLFPPTDHTKLGFKPGSTTSDVNVFDDQDGKCESDTTTSMPGSYRQEGDTASSKFSLRGHEAVLRPGDILYIPPLWPHAVDAPRDGASIAVNIFFRTFERERYAAGRDVYGNRDLQAYEQGRLGINRIARAFEGLPADVRIFYIERLARELMDLSGGEGKAKGA